jgi:hypothetical protein
MHKTESKLNQGTKSKPNTKSKTLPVQKETLQTLQTKIKYSNNQNIEVLRETIKRISSELDNFETPSISFTCTITILGLLTQNQQHTLPIKEEKELYQSFQCLVILDRKNSQCTWFTIDPLCEEYLKQNELPNRVTYNLLQALCIFDRFSLHRIDLSSMFKSRTLLEKFCYLLFIFVKFTTSCDSIASQISSSLITQKEKEWSQDEKHWTQYIYPHMEKHCMMILNRMHSNLMNILECGSDTEYVKFCPENLDAKHKDKEQGQGQREGQHQGQHQDQHQGQDQDQQRDRKYPFSLATCTTGFTPFHKDIGEHQSDIINEKHSENSNEHISDFSELQVITMIKTLIMQEVATTHKQHLIHALKGK